MNRAVCPVYGASCVVRNTSTTCQHYRETEQAIVIKVRGPNENDEYGVFNPEDGMWSDWVAPDRLVLSPDEREAIRWHIVSAPFPEPQLEGAIVRSTKHRNDWWVRDPLGQWIVRGATTVWDWADVIKTPVEVEFPGFKS